MSTGRPSLIQVMLGGGMPLDIHSRLMGLWRTTERSAGPVLRMDGGTGEVKRVLHKKQSTAFSAVSDFHCPPLIDTDLYRRGGHPIGAAVI